MPIQISTLILTFFVFKAGIYTCTAYNDLNSLKMSISLNVYYKPTCRIRNEETIDGGLNLRCDVDAFPQNVTYIWTHNDQPIPASNGPTLYYRHANSLLKKAKEGDVESIAAIFGTFACQASNIAGNSLDFIGKKIFRRIGNFI